MKKAILFVVMLTFAIPVMNPSFIFAQAKDGGMATIGIPNDIAGVDPHKHYAFIDGQIWGLMCENLVTALKDHLPGPALAESWKMSADAREYTFSLRKGVKFHNGRELTAEDIKWNFDRMMDPKTASGMKTRLEKVESVTVVDKYTVKFRLKIPSGGFLAFFYGASVQSPIMAKESLNPDGTITRPIGTGPFEFVEWVPHDHIKVKKFKNYWQKGLPHLDEILLKVVPDEVSRLTAVRAGDLDFSYMLPIEEVSKIMRAPSKDFSVGVLPGGTNYFCFNSSTKPFSDPKVRQAVFYAVNREEFSQANTFGHGQVANQFFPAGHPWHSEVNSPKQDLAKAKQLLTEAGHPNGFDTAMLTDNTQNILLTSAQIVQAQLKKIGITVKLDVKDFTTHIAQMRKGEFQITNMWAAASADPDVYYPMALSSQGAYNWGKWKNPQMDELLNKGAGAPTMEERKKYYTQAVTLLVNEGPMVYLHTVPLAYGMRARLKGFEPAIGLLFVRSDGGMQFAYIDK